MISLFRLCQAMEELVEKGLCKAIGISNYTIKKTEDLLKTAKIMPACNQGELMYFFQLSFIRPVLGKSYCLVWLACKWYIVVFVVECHPYFRQEELKKYCDSKGRRHKKS